MPKKKEKSFNVKYHKPKYCKYLNIKENRFALFQECLLAFACIFQTDKQKRTNNVSCIHYYHFRFPSYRFLK